MADIEQIKRDTREALGLEDDPLEHITEDLVEAYQGWFDSEGGEDIDVVTEEGNPASEDDVAEVGPESTRTFLGHHHARLGACLYWQTNGVGQPCGTGFRVRACNWRSARADVITRCPAGYPGYRYTFTY